jgi:hypothetical protein
MATWLRTYASVSASRGSVVRGNLISQIVSRTGPIGSVIPPWKRILIEGISVLETLDMTDVGIEIGVTFSQCSFLNPDESVNLTRTRFGRLMIVDCHFVGRFIADNIAVETDFLLVRCWIQSTLRVHQGAVKGNTVLDGVRVERSDQNAVILDGSSFSGFMTVIGCSVWGGLVARHATLASAVDIRQSVMGDASNEPALNLDMSNALSNVTVGPQFIARGAVRMAAAFVGGTLTFQGVDIRASGADSMVLDRLRAAGGLTLHGASKLSGHLRLGGASMERLEIKDIEIVVAGPEPVSLTADGLTIVHDIRIGPGFATRGEMRFLGTKAGGQFLFFEPDPAMRKPLLINAEGMALGGGMFIEEIHPRSQLMLANARLDAITLNTSHPPRMELLRAEYGYIGDDEGAVITPAQAEQLLSAPLVKFSIAPYRAMAVLYSSLGRDADASRINISGERRAWELRRPLARVWGLILRGTVGYGYTPLSALYWLGALLLLGTTVFGAMYNGELFWIPVWTVISADQFADGQDGGLFNPLTYAVAALVPGGNEWLTGWTPVSTAAEMVTLGGRVLGWTLATAVVAGVARRLTRRST